MRLQGQMEFGHGSTSLVKNDIEIENKLVWALSRAKIPATAVDWNWVPQLEEWQLTVVTSLVETQGPRSAYTRILKALSDDGVYQLIPIGKLFVKSPNDPIAKKLIEEIKRKVEGSIHIVRNTGKKGTPRYNLVFAPYVGSGGPIPSKRLADDADLRIFLEKRLAIDSFVVDGVLPKLAQRHSATIFNVQLSLRRAKKLNLAA